MVLCWLVMTLAVGMAFISLSEGAGNGEPCQADSDCSVDNQYCRGLADWTAQTCSKGQCFCVDTHLWDSSAGKCKIKKMDGEQCVDADDKCVTGTCSSGTCSCASGYTYNSNLQNCLENNKKLLGEGCAMTSDCYGSIGTVTCDTTCKCETGYIEEIYVCRKPHVGEVCIATTASPPGVVCASMMNTDPSLATETCQSDTCACPSGSTRVQKTVRNTGYDFCVVTFSGTQKPDSSTCDSHNSCQSYLCMTCPGDSAKTCLRESGAIQWTMSLITTLVTVIPLFLTKVMLS